MQGGVGIGDRYIHKDHVWIQFGQLVKVRGHCQARATVRGMKPRGHHATGFVAYRGLVFLESIYSNDIGRSGCGQGSARGQITGLPCAGPEQEISHASFKIGRPPPGRWCRSGDGSRVRRLEGSGRPRQGRGGGFVVALRWKPPVVKLLDR
jgi:hypothetical protein